MTLGHQDCLTTYLLFCALGTWAGEYSQQPPKCLVHEQQHLFLKKNGEWNITKIAKSCATDKNIKTEEVLPDDPR